MEQGIVEVKEGFVEQKGKDNLPLLGLFVFVHKQVGNFTQTFFNDSLSPFSQVPVSFGVSFRYLPRLGFRSSYSLQTTTTTIFFLVQ